MNRRQFQYRANLVAMAIAGLWCANSAVAQSPTIRAVALSDQPAPGTPNGEVYLGFNPFYASLNDAGQVAFLGSAMFTDGSGINEGVWSEGTGELVLVAKEHAPAPGADSNMRFSTFQNTVLNNAGQTLFEAGLTNFVTDERGTWSNRTGVLARVIGNGVQAPGTSDGTTFIGFSGSAFNDLGQTAFKAGVTGVDVVNTNGEGIWSDGSGTLTLVARGGSQAAGMPVGENFDVLDFPVLNNHGQTAFYGYVVGGEAGSGQGIWSEQAGVLGLVASSGNPAPGAHGGANFQGFSSPSFNNAGKTSFWAYLDSSNPNAGESYHDGIWSEGSGSLELVALRGEQAPGMPTGVHYGRENTITFDSPVLNDVGQVAFRGQVGGAGVDDTNEEAIWIGDAQGVALVARAGDQAPGAPEGVTFDTFFPWHGALQLSEAGQAVFTAFLIDEAVQPISGGYGIWATDSQGDLTLIARTGQELEISPGDFRSIIDLNLVGEATGSSDGRPSAVNSHGQIAFWAKYDGGEGIFVSNQVALPEPSTLLLVTMGLWAAVFSRPDMRASVQRRLRQLMGVLLIMLSANIASADIFEWEYINHANPAEGKRQSTILTPTGAGAIAEPGAFLPGRDLTKAYLIGYNLDGYWVDGGELGQPYIVFTNLSGADLSQADLTNASLSLSTLDSAIFANAEVRGARFDFSDLSAAQLYSTASYQAHDLSRISLGYHYLTDWNLANQNLTDANFSNATLTAASFDNAVIKGAVFDYNELVGGTGISAVQLASTASYKARDLSGIGLAGNLLSNADFTGQNLYRAHFQYAILTNANFSQANLSNAVFTEATLTGANLNQANLAGADLNGATLTSATMNGADIHGASISHIAAEQLYSTASYQTHDLTGIGLGGANLPGVTFTAQNLTNAGFGGATLTGTNFSQSNLTNANFFQASLKGATFTEAVIRGANFVDYGAGGISKEQIYATASYKSRDLAGIKLAGNDLRGGNFAGQDFANADLALTTLSNGDFSQANLQNVDFEGASVNNVNLSKANLVNANFNFAYLTGSNLQGALVRGATFYRIADPLGDYGSGLTVAQLQSTASYKAHDLRDIILVGNNLAGVSLDGQNLTNAQLGSSDSHDVTDLSGASFIQANLAYATLSYAKLRNANLSQSNLTNVSLYRADLSNAILTGAEVRGANFSANADSLTLPQLYSTASYKAHNLTGIKLGGFDLIGANLADQDLTDAAFADGATGSSNLAGADFSRANLKNVLFANANLVGANFAHANLSGARLGSEDFFYGGADLSNANLSHAKLANANFAGYEYESVYPGANLSNANLTGADARGAAFQYATMTGANTTNMIQTNGHVAGLNLTSGESLFVRDYDGNPAAFPPTGALPIVVDEQAVMDASSSLQFVFDADLWDSTISFAEGIPVTLGGKLDLEFAKDVDIAAQAGRTITVFNWEGASPTGAFSPKVSAGTLWDLSKLYTSGDVTLIAVHGPGDIDGNGKVDLLDFATLRSHFGSSGDLTDGDLTGDFQINLQDFAVLRNNFGRTGVAAAVPEPAILMLSAIPLALLVYRRSNRRVQSQQCSVQTK